jgi:hypothetical protein
LASAARGSTITLDDVDIVIPPADDENLGNLGLALAHLGAEPIGADDAHRSSYVTAAGQLDVIELGEAYDGLAERATNEDLGNGVVARVASTADLMELKRAPATSWEPRTSRRSRTSTTSPSWARPSTMRTRPSRRARSGSRRCGPRSRTSTCI